MTKKAAMNPISGRSANHCTLCRLHNLGHLRDNPTDTLRQARLRHEVGERLQNDAVLSELTVWPKSASTSPGKVNGVRFGPVDLTQIRMDAKRRCDAALAHVGRSGAGVLSLVLIDDLTLAQAARHLGIKDNAVLPALRVALDALTVHYGLDGYSAPARIRGGSTSQEAA